MQLKRFISATLLLSLLGTSPIFADTEATPTQPNENLPTNEQNTSTENTPSVPETETTIDENAPTDLEIIESLDEHFYTEEQNDANQPLKPPVLKVVPLGKSKSNFSTSIANRKFNIKKAAATINGKVLQPGEIFDFNQTVGAASQAQGYRNAKVFMDGKVVDGFGGGVCQVSSTLFNAALNSGMDIVQRRSHSLRITYYPAGYDAAVSYGSLNFKFKNTYKVPVKIKASADNNNITVELVALQDTPKRVVSLSREKKGANSYVVSRKIKENNVIIKKDAFRSTYGVPKKD